MGIDSYNNKPHKKRPTVSFEVVNETYEARALRAAIVEIGHTSLGISVKTPLKVGSVLKFTKMKNVDRPLPSQGIVMWTMEDGKMHRAGIRLY